MVSNPNKEDHAARRFVDKIISKVTTKGISYDTIVHQTVLNFGVSIGSVEKFIDRFYINNAEMPYENVDGILRKVEE